MLWYPVNPQDILKSRFSFNNKKRNISSLWGLISAFCGINLISYVLKLAETGLKKGQFWGFHNILTPNFIFIYSD